LQRGFSLILRSCNLRIDRARIDAHLTRTRAQNKRLQVQQALIDWRRSQVIQLIHEGKTLNEIERIIFHAGQAKHSGFINKNTRLSPMALGVRYQVKDVQRSIAFYTQTLGFNLDRQNLPAFGQVSIGNLKLIFSGPGASGSRPMPDGRKQEPGGWNRIVPLVQDLPARIADLKNQGVHFRNEMEVGPGGRQIQVEDPDGNPVELFEPARST
jgi:glyoxylase I family protein